MVRGSRVTPFCNDEALFDTLTSWLLFNTRTLRRVHFFTKRNQSAPATCHINNSTRSPSFCTDQKEDFCETTPDPVHSGGWFGCKHNSDIGTTRPLRPSGTGRTGKSHCMCGCHVNLFANNSNLYLQRGARLLSRENFREIGFVLILNSSFYIFPFCLKKNLLK